MKAPSVKHTVLEHLGRSICGARYNPDVTFVMLTAYFDEGVSDREGFLVVAGWLSDLRDWERFESDWRIFLAQYDVPYLHMKEYSQSKGPFAKWEGKQWSGTRRNFIHDAAEIISACARWGFISHVSHAVFWRTNERYRLTERFHSPYALAGWSAISLVNDWCERVGNTSDIKYVFEDGGPDKGGLVASIEDTPAFLQIPTFESSRDVRLNRKFPHGKRGLIQLQAADYLAYETRRGILDLHDKRPGRKSFRALPFQKIDTLVYTDAGLVNTCKKLNIQKRIPKW
jgi:hypothetical protein